MATKANAKQPSGQSSGNRGGGSGFYVPPAFDVVDKPDEEGYKLLIVLICLMLVLPLFLYLMASMYFDMLLLKQEIKQQQAIVRRLLIKDEK